MSQNPNRFSLLDSLFKENEEIKRKIFKSVKAKFDSRRNFSERIADFMTLGFGSMSFLILNLVAFTVWILINIGKISFIPALDPFPFNFLTTFVSLEAIFLAVFVLISQNRAIRIDDLRGETHLQINLITEKEITKIIKMLIVLLEKQGVDISQDPELKKMLRPLSEEEIERKLEKEIL